MPSEAAGDGRTRVLLAVLADPRPTWDSVMTRTGLSRGTVNRHLALLRRDGLVDWTDGRKGTLRPRVRVVPRRWAS